MTGRHPAQRNSFGEQESPKGVFVPANMPLFSRQAMGAREREREEIVAESNQSLPFFSMPSSFLGSEDSNIGSLLARALQPSSFPAPRKQSMTAQNLSKEDLLQKV